MVFGRSCRSCADKDALIALLKAQLSDLRQDLSIERRSQREREDKLHDKILSLAGNARHSPLEPRQRTERNAQEPAGSIFYPELVQDRRPPNPRPFVDLGALEALEMDQSLDKAVEGLSGLDKVTSFKGGS